MSQDHTEVAVEFTDEDGVTTLVDPTIPHYNSAGEIFFPYATEPVLDDEPAEPAEPLGDSDGGVATGENVAAPTESETPTDNTTPTA